MKNFKSKIGLLFFLLCMLGVQPELSAQTKEIEKAEKRQEKQKKSEEEIQEEGRKRHKKIQDKATRKRMKRSLREAERRKKGKNPVPWYRRIFRKKKKTKRYKGGK